MRKLGLQRDLAEAAALERRRQGELHRQSRIFNARVRTAGVDKDALDTQINDKKIQEANEKARHEIIAGEMKQNDKIICMLEERQKQDIKNLNKAVTEFQQNFQKPETRREFDLSDPQALKKDTPARLSDSDPRCTVSGLQKFLGEDLNYDQRVKFQKEQSREWSLQQQRDWKNALADQKFADHEQFVHHGHVEIPCVPMILYFADAVEFAERKMLEKHQEEEDNVAEISNLLRGDLLSENPEQAASSFGRHRVITDRWKGMNQDQLKAIRYTQQQQVLEKLRLQEEERQRNAEWDRQRIQGARAQLLFERHQQRLNRELRRTLDNANAQLSQEQKSKKIYLQEEVYSNFPTGQYFTQFNTTSR
ncbi:unnamed protein product [Eretmochelys imbricata]